LIKEDFIHYLWKFSLFDISNLTDIQGEKIQILNVGTHNKNAGPDFFNAKLVIDGQLWAGNVEIHIKSSDWYVHHHEQDSTYDNVILHVVWEHDVAVFRADNSRIPTFVIQPYISKKLISNYYQLFSKSNPFIFCENDIQFIDKFTLNNFIDSLYIERLQQKSVLILDLLKELNNDWEAVLFVLLSKNFGLKVNGDSFFNLAQSFDFSVFRKNSNDVFKIEALLFGQAGLLNLELSDDDYFIKLSEEYQFLKNKYQLSSLHKSEIQFFRLRPANFPTIRLSQLANLYANNQGLFSKLMNTYALDDFYKLLTVSTSIYWKTHYSFYTTSKKSVKKLTKAFIDLVLINTIIPLQFVYQQYIDQLEEDKIISLIKQIKPEKNSIIQKFKEIKISSSNALETQALIQLKNTYCIKQRCLECVVGNKLLRKTE